MRKLISVILICTLLLSGCAVPISNSISSETAIPEVSTHDESHSSQTEGEGTGLMDVVEAPVDEPAELPANHALSNPQPDITIKGLDDAVLLQYVEDNVYTSLIQQLNSEDYFIENVEAIYYPKEYIEALAFNSQSNRYFGYTANELNEQFQGTKYVFTLGKDGQTIVVPMVTVNDDIYVKAMEDVLIGTGIILICVTVSLVATPAVPAVGMIFAASASTGTVFALESGVISFAAAAIAKGYETESFDEAIKAGVAAGGEDFKWGAIVGVAVGGAKETIALKGATLNGLTMNDAARIQKESNYPLELIKQFKSFEEYEVYKNAGLYTKIVNGKLALVRNIDLEYVSELPTGEKVTNLVRMKKGYAPIDPATGKAYQLHHINQNSNGTLAILTEAEHQGNSTILNLFGKESEIDRKAFDAIRKEFWQKFAAGLL